MRKLLIAAVTATIMSAGGGIPAEASAAGAHLARAEKNTWMTKSIRKRVIAAAERGVPVATVHRWAFDRGRRPPEEPEKDTCPTSDPTRGDVYTGACQVYPYSCTMNFIYKRGDGVAATSSDGRNYFIGTAGHCVERANQPVFIQNNGVYVHVGYVDKILHGGGNSQSSRGVGGIGNDFASVQIEAGRTIDPASPVGGPEGIYTGCDPTGIKFWGHGFGVAVAQGQPGAGLAHLWFDRSFAWIGDGLPGDSGSGVLTQSNEAGGILTHLNIDLDRYPGATHAGTRVTRALTFLGGRYYLVNQDYTTTRATMADTRCGNADSGSGEGVLGTLIG